MQIKPIHSWNVPPREAIRIQKALAQRIIPRTPFAPTCPFDTIHTVAGVDVGIKGDMAKAAVVVLSYPDLQLLDQSTIVQPIPFPYVPGLLSFRECPSLLAAFEHLSLEPDLIIVDGQGIAHPRRIRFGPGPALLLSGTSYIRRRSRGFLTPFCGVSG